MIRSFQNNTPRIHESAYIAENATVIGDVEIAAWSSIWFGCVLRGDVNSIRIGERTNIQDGTIIHVSRAKRHSTTIEDEVTIGHSATIHGCVVETGCLIGIGAIVLDGAQIGRNSLVGAGALVTPETKIPPRSLVLGSPAKVVRKLTDDEIANLEKFCQGYIELSTEYKR
ncbi:MAG: gamma carbonic anhydrase family protein [Pyrinomonadaceae bacterium]